MTDRDLGALLDRASAHVAEVDFADGAWALAVAEQRRRRRVVAGTVGAVAAACLAVAAVQLGGSSTPRPHPVVSTTTQADRGNLSDGTAYAVMPLEGDEGELRHFDAPLPSVIDLRAEVTRLSDWTTPPESVVAVYLRADGPSFHPVLVTAVGRQVLADKVTLVPTTDPGGNTAAPLGPRAVGGGGRYIVFPQPDHVVRLDTHTGDTVSYAVPSDYVEWAGWTADNGAIVARAAGGKAWTIDPWKPGAKAQRADGTYEGLFRLTMSGVSTNPGGVTPAPMPAQLMLTSDQRAPLGEPLRMTSPVSDVWGETISTEEWAATGAFFDQNLTSSVIRRGNGPIYQGLVAVDVGHRSARVLLAPENPDGQTGRSKGCCTVLSWADGNTVLFQSVGSHGRWILAWDVTTGEVFEATRFTGTAADSVTPIALNVGWRY